MRKSRAVSIALAAMTTVLTIGASSVYATGGGLTAAQVRNIVKQEVAKSHGSRDQKEPRGQRAPEAR